MTEWMIYGAYGYTGELIARQAKAAGLRPVLAGRQSGRVAALASQLDLPHRAFGLDAPALGGIGLVLNCAGPFSATAAPLMAACIAARTHYLDITGEIDVFEHAHGLSAEAHTAGVVLCAGVGFDVIPTDCLACALVEALPDATHLALGFETASGLSSGTAKTSVEGLGQGGRVRRNGKIITESIGFRVRNIDFGNGPRLAMALPWGDVSTAFYTTGIPNIEVFCAVSPALLWSVRATNLLAPLLRMQAVQTLLKQRAAAVEGPGTQARVDNPMWVWGEVRNKTGTIRSARIKTANGYDVTVRGSLLVVQHLLTSGTTRGGFFTPSRLCGVGLITKVDGSGPLIIS